MAVVRCDFHASNDVVGNRVIADLSALYGKGLPVMTSALVSVSAPPVVYWVFSAIADPSTLRFVSFDSEASCN